MNKYSLVATYPTEFEAKLAESILSEAGIPSFVQVPDVYPPLDYTRGIKVMVHPENAETAKELLADVEGDESDKSSA
jgi:hypothetical protein